MKAIRRAAVAAAVASACAIAIAPARAEPVASAGVMTVQVGAWKALTSSAAIADALRSADLAGADAMEPSELASKLQALVAERSGILSLDTRVDSEARTVSIEAEPVKTRAGGAYASIFSTLDGEPLTSSDLEARARLAREASRYDNRSVALRLGSSTEPGGPMPLDVDSALAAGPSSGGSVNLSTYGQRYSGRDIETVSGWRRMGGQTQAQASSTAGLPFPREDSRGGRYYSESAEIDHVFSRFSGDAKLSDTRYKMGGPLRRFDETGRVDRLDLEGMLPLTAASTALFGAGYIDQATRIGAAGLSEHTGYGYAVAGLGYDADGCAATAKAFEGLGGSRFYNVAPLSGDFDPAFHALAVDGRCAKALGGGWSLELAGAAQAGSRGTPSAMQFYGGGLDRGRSFNTGNIAGRSGEAASASVSRELGHGASLYAGVDGSRVKPDLGPSMSEASAFAGIRADLGAGGALDFGVAKGFKGGRGSAALLSWTLAF